MVEVNARDRPALLFELARAIFVSRALIHSAHIATYGERAVDVFYLTDMSGRKIEGDSTDQRTEGATDEVRRAERSSEQGGLKERAPPLPAEPPPR